MSVLMQDDRPEAAPDNVVVLVAPPAAVAVLRAVLDHLPTDFPAAIIILAHTGTQRERPIDLNLNVNPRPMVANGAAGMALRNNRAYVVRPEQNLVIGGDGRLTAAYGTEANTDAFLLHNDQTSPSAEVVRSDGILASLASRYGSGAIAVALTALDAREQEGFRRVREAGGKTISLDESDRLWADAKGVRVVPMEGDALVLSHKIGDRMFTLFTVAKVPVAR